MSCCRDATTAVLHQGDRVRIRYLGGRPVQPMGVATKAVYLFSGIDRVRLVDPRDAVALARHPMFRIEGVVRVPDGTQLSGE